MKEKHEINYYKKLMWNKRSITLLHSSKLKPSREKCSSHLNQLHCDVMWLMAGKVNYIWLSSNCSLWSSATASTTTTAYRLKQIKINILFIMITQKRRNKINYNAFTIHIYISIKWRFHFKLKTKQQTEP